MHCPLLVVPSGLWPTSSFRGNWGQGSSHGSCDLCSFSNYISVLEMEVKRLFCAAPSPPGSGAVSCGGCPCGDHAQCPGGAAYTAPQRDHPALTWPIFLLEDLLCGLRVVAGPLWTSDPRQGPEPWRRPKETGGKASGTQEDLSAAGTETLMQPRGR